MSLASSANSSITKALFTFPSWTNPSSVYSMPDDGADHAVNVVSFLWKHDEYAMCRTDRSGCLRIINS